MFQATAISVRYPQQQRSLLQDISFCLKRGEVLWVQGANGSGKSTLLYALTGVIPQQIEAERQGEITLDGVSIAHKPINKLIPQVMLGMHNPAWQLFFQTVESEFVFALENIGLSESEIEQRLSETYADFELRQYKQYNPTQLSWGWQKVMVTALCAIVKPQVLLLDEPFNGLSEGSVDIVLRWMSKYVAQGGILIVAEHSDVMTGLHPQVLHLGRI